MKKYKTIAESTTHQLDVSLNYWAEMGWEAHSILERAGTFVAIMERESYELV